MSSNSENTITDELRQHFKALITEIFSDLQKEKVKVDALRFYYDEDIPKTMYGASNFLISLEDVGKISYTNFSSLKKVLLSALGREDLADALRCFAIKRKVALLLDAFVSILRQNLLLEAFLSILRQNPFENIKAIARCRAKSTDDALDKKIVMIFLEEEIETNQSEPCTKKLPLLTVIAGELLSETETKNKEFAGLLPIAVMRCSAEICSTMKSSGKWVRPVNRWS